jgi:hypothetical protein
VDAVDILKICFRRWYVMLPILIGAAGVSYQLIETQETTYTAAASYGLVQPRLTAGTPEAERNPLGSDGSDLVGAALEAQLNSRVTQQQLGSETTRGWGPGESDNGSSYSVKIPMFETTYEVRAYGPDEQAVQDVVNRVIEAAPDIADDLQTRAGASEAVRYEPFVLAPTQVDALPATSALKLVIAVMGVGTLVGAAWSIVADRLLRRRRVGGDTAGHAGSTPSDEEDDSLGSPDPSTAARTASTATTSTTVGKTKNGQAGLKPGTKPDKSGKTAGSTDPGGGRRDRRHRPLVRR